MDPSSHHDDGNSNDSVKSTYDKNLKNLRALLIKKEKQNHHLENLTQSLKSNQILKGLKITEKPTIFEKPGREFRTNWTEAHKHLSFRFMKLSVSDASSILDKYNNQILKFHRNMLTDYRPEVAQSIFDHFEKNNKQIYC